MSGASNLGSCEPGELAGYLAQAAAFGPLSAARPAEGWTDGAPLVGAARPANDRGPGNIYVDEASGRADPPAAGAWPRWKELVGCTVRSVATTERA
jgi:hypothetical protein